VGACVSKTKHQRKFAQTRGTPSKSEKKKTQATADEWFGEGELWGVEGRAPKLTGWNIKRKRSTVQKVVPGILERHTNRKFVGYEARENGKSGERAD